PTSAPTASPRSPRSPPAGRRSRAPGEQKRGSDRMDRYAPAIVVVLLGTLLGVGAFLVLRPGRDDSPPVAAPTTTTTTSGRSSTSTPDGGSSATTVPGPVTTTLPERPRDVVPSWTVGRPWGSVPGVTMFR